MFSDLRGFTSFAETLEPATVINSHNRYLTDSTRSFPTVPADDLLEVGEFEVRGRVAKIKLWSLREEPETDEQPSEATVEVST
jgi:class 3 adenylate cyclase